MKSVTRFSRAGRGTRQTREKTRAGSVVVGRGESVTPYGERITPRYDSERRRRNRPARHLRDRFWLRHYLDDASIGNRGRRDLPPSCLSALDSVEASADELDGPRHAGG